MGVVRCMGFRIVGDDLVVSNDASSSDFINACWEGTDLVIKVNYGGREVRIMNPTSAELTEELLAIMSEELVSKVVLELSLHGFTADRLASV